MFFVWLHFGILIWVQFWTQIRTPKCHPGREICTKTQTRTCRHDLHSMVFYLAILIQLCATNQQLNQRRGKPRPAKLLKQRRFLHLQTKHGQDSKHVFLAEDTKAKIHVWENRQHARYSKGTPTCHCKTACFEALVLEPPFDQILGRPMFACLPFLTFLGTKPDPFFVIYIYIVFCSKFHSPRPASKPASKCFVPNFHSLATLEVRFKACLETCLIHANFLFCCNFHSLEASRSAVPLRQLRPKILARHQNSQLLQVQPC